MVNIFFSSSGFVQCLQFRYQHGVLYRLKALGERHNMDITIEGFHSWMWRGLSFLLPFLFIGYFFQLYNAYTLYSLMSSPETTWHVPVLSAMFFILFMGNLITTIVVIPQKWQDRLKSRLPGVFNFKVDRRKKCVTTKDGYPPLYPKTDESDEEQSSDDNSTIPVEQSNTAKTDDKKLC